MLDAPGDDFFRRRLFQPTAGGCQIFQQLRRRLEPTGTPLQASAARGCGLRGVSTTALSNMTNFNGLAAVVVGSGLAS